MAFTVYDTKQNKYYDIHPSMARDKQWMQSRGLILQEEPKKMEVTNMPEETEKPEPVVKITAPKATPKTTPAKQA